MNLIGELHWEITRVLHNWAISLVTLLLLIRWAGHERRTHKHV
jgi:hypothetical protein